ncbi:hypothetical protein [Halomonas denitrificans]|uniref:hypothetical protein n=1 Tax=Halomonas denitrificans TaxID=370769 RepID=UPI001C99DB33|nr:hypothetical protein [Halomonas denitrificans]MBY5967726.1 hypothetical protein [Halomonas denitrificans]
MSYRIKTALHGANPTLEIFDVSSGSMRMAWEYPKVMANADTDPELAAMRREEAIHELFRRLFLLTTEQYLKGELGKGASGK